MSLGTLLRIAARRILGPRRSTLWALLGMIVASALLAAVIASTAGEHAYLRRRLMQVTPLVSVSADRLSPLVPRRLVELDGGVVELVVNTPPTDRHEIKPRVEVATRARRSSAGVVGVAPFVLLKGVLRNGPRYHVVELHGVDPSHEPGLGRTPHERRRGAMAQLRSVPDGTIIGERLARRLGVAAGRDLTLITAAGVVRRLHVIDVFRSDVIAVDEDRVYINIELAQSLRGMARNAATGLALGLSDPARAAHVARAVERATGYRTRTWEQAQADVLGSYRARELAAWAVAALGLVVAAFALANALSASVLASLERSPKRIVAGAAGLRVSAPTVLAEGALVGLLGGAVGSGLGLAAAYLLSRGGLGAPSFIATFVRFERPPVALDASVVLATLGLAVLASLAASIAPARHARQADAEVDA